MEIDSHHATNDGDDSLWNHKIEGAAKNIGESAKGYKLLHIREAQQANKMYTRLMAAGIVLGPMSSLLAGIKAAIDPPQEDPAVL